MALTRMLLTPAEAELRRKAHRIALTVLAEAAAIDDATYRAWEREEVELGTFSLERIEEALAMIEKARGAG